ncbi:hypothetical protein QUF49_12720 [Fictibacillus sp. b24]|uniref:hypothetical protein n=1 Tax=unclassified Fictibacillus TaxID=2644029 RepID=UPI00259FF58B|nr:hypothetical protein [Fictibacillus sp. b24]MDM5316862.1 hypothetical protein [Fictibacillus sp. b24]
MQYGSEEERSLIEKFVMYPILLTVFNRDLQIINGSPLKLRQPYVALIEQIMNQISKDLYDVRVELRKRRIKVMDGRREADITEYEIFIRGYREIMRFPNVHLKNKAETLMLSYLHVTAE